MGSRRVVLLVVHAQMHAGRLDVLTSLSAKWWVSVVSSVSQGWSLQLLGFPFGQVFVVAVEERGECFVVLYFFFDFLIFFILYIVKAVRV